MASEEEPDIIPIPDEFKCGKYVLLFDPLDGSSNIDVNVPVGTIFSVVGEDHARTAAGNWRTCCSRAAGRSRPATSSTARARCWSTRTGQGVHGFTLDPDDRRVPALAPDIRIPERGRYLSRERAYEQVWDDPVMQLMRRYRGLDGVRKPHERRGTSARSSPTSTGTCSAAGSFSIPPNTRVPNGKLRLLYEANPLAFIVERRRRGATDGRHRILDIEPRNCTSARPLFIGSREDVQTARRLSVAPARTGAGAAAQ